MSEPDGETRLRVLAVATKLFAAGGFKKVTVRQICLEAHANVAAVNYHFGDKLGLYREVLGKAIETMKATTEAARDAGNSLAPEEKLRAYIRVFIRRVYHKAHEPWIHHLMAQEMADPTPALDLVVDQVHKPRLAYLTEVVAEILRVPPSDPRVLLSVVSIQTQCIAPLMNPFSRRLGVDMVPDEASVEALATHIEQFSLGGLRAVTRD
jgi:TetR/AcrR family transcriptional regulator, regulator of cefoperazone and chloramphenicol sensitivity